MPTKCCVLDCGATKSRNQPTLTFHRLPRNAAKRKMWLDAIGKDNISTENKVTFVCSLHFEESSFNRTLAVMRLKDDAVPTLFMGVRSSPEIKQQPVKGTHDPLDLSDQASKVPVSTQRLSRDALAALKENKLLKEKIASLKRILKCRNEIIRRQNIKLGKHTKNVKRLKKTNIISTDKAVSLEQGAGPKKYILKKLSQPEDIRDIIILVT